MKGNPTTILQQLRLEPAGFRLFYLLSMLFVSSLLISNTIAGKIVQIGPLTLPAGTMCFPIAYIFNDVMVEVYGYNRSRVVIWAGFLCLIIMAVLYSLAIVIPPATFWKDQPAFETVFGVTPRLVLASLIAYLGGAFVNSSIMSRLKVVTQGRHLWLRTISSTFFGEGVDSIIFNLLAFSGVFELTHLLSIIVSAIVAKTSIEIVATPFTYLVVRWFKEVEDTDSYDHNVNYNPFQI